MSHHNFGSPVVKYPRFVNMQKPIPNVPPNSVLERGPDSVRGWFLRKSRLEGERRKK